MDSGGNNQSKASTPRGSTTHWLALAATLLMIVGAAIALLMPRTALTIAVGMVCLGLAALGSIVVARCVGRPLARATEEERPSLASVATARIPRPPSQEQQALLDADLQQKVIAQASTLERSRGLERFLPPAVVRTMTERDRPSARRRARLTVFRLELRGFEEQVESTEPEDIAAMLNGYLSEIVEVAFSHGATVDKFIRDTVVGYFGAPESVGAEQDALRCAKLGLELWQRAVAVCERWKGLLQGGPPLPTLVLTTGFATVGNFGSSNRMEYTAVGGSIADAEALIASVAAGEVICSESTYTSIEGQVEGVACGEVTLRRSRPTKIFRLAGPPQSLMLSGSKDPTAPLPGALADTLPPDGRALPITETGEIEPGSQIGERYKVIRALGSGGMGTIYLAYDGMLGSNIALKVLRPDYPGAEPTARLHHEVKLARLVSHPNVARIYDIGESGGFEFISMEYISGETLEARLLEGRLSVRDGLEVFGQLCAGLAAAHAAGIVHGDLKPANIMLEAGGRVVILDFGIARWATSIKPTEAEPEALGTPQYMAPEQFKGGADVDQRADIYSLGVLAFEVFTGQRPFNADSVVSLAYLHAAQQPQPPQQLNPELPPRLAAVILTCLAKAARDRFGSVSEIASCLTEFQVADDGMVRRIVAPPSS